MATDDAVDLSYSSMEGSSPLTNPIELLEIDTIGKLASCLDNLFVNISTSASLHSAIILMLSKVNLSQNEINKFTFWDADKPYTRNLAFTDNKHYTILILCWNPGKESKIHNHPCDACYIKTLRGCLRESLFSVDTSNNTMAPIGVRFYTESQVSFMTDDIGLHKIGNPNRQLQFVCVLELFR